MSELVTTAGDDLSLQLELQRNRIPVDLSTASISVTVTSEDGETVYIPATLQSQMAPGADWRRGIVIVEIDGDQTGLLPPGRLRYLVQVFDGDRRTTWKEFYIRNQLGKVS